MQVGRAQLTPLRPSHRRSNYKPLPKLPPPTHPSWLPLYHRASQPCIACAEDTGTPVPRARVSYATSARSNATPRLPEANAPGAARRPSASTKSSADLATTNRARLKDVQPCPRRVEGPALRTGRMGSLSHTRGTPLLKRRTCGIPAAIIRAMCRHRARASGPSLDPGDLHPRLSCHRRRVIRPTSSRAVLRTKILVPSPAYRRTTGGKRIPYAVEAISPGLCNK